MDISIVTGFQKGQISGQNSPHSLLKNVLSKLYFQRKGHLYANCLFYSLIIYLKCLLCQFIGCGIIMQIPLLTGVQK